MFHAGESLTTLSSLVFPHILCACSAVPVDLDVLVDLPAVVVFHAVVREVVSP